MASAAVATWATVGGVRRGFGWTGPAAGATAPPTAVFGFNVAGNGRSVQGRQAWWAGRAPMIRYDNPGMLPGAFELTVAGCPERRVAYTFRDGGGYSTAQIASGAADARMKAWLQSIPAGWSILWTYRPAPNGPAGLELPAVDLTGAYTRMRVALTSAALKPGVSVAITANFAAARLTPTTSATWSDAWVPARASADLLTFDWFGDPGTNTAPCGATLYGGPATGPDYGSTYPDPDVRAFDMLAVLDRVQGGAYADAWGILAVNTPGRDWDAAERGRAAWLTDAYELLMGRAHPPAVVLLCEGPGGAWDESFGRLSGDPSSSPCIAALRPYIEGSP